MKNSFKAWCIAVAFVFELLATGGAAVHAAETEAAPGDVQMLEKEWIGINSSSGWSIASRLKLDVGAAVVQDGHREPAFWITGTVEQMHLSEVAAASGRKRNQTPATVLSSQQIKGHYRPLSRTIAFLSPQMWDYDQFNRGRTTAIISGEALVFGLAGPARKVQGVSMHADRFPDLLRAVSTSGRSKNPQADEVMVQAYARTQIEWWKNWLGQRLDTIAPGADADRQISAAHEWVGSVLEGDRPGYQLIVQKARAATQRVVGSSAELAIVEIENAPPGQRTLDLAEAWQHRYSSSTSQADRENYLRLVDRSVKAVDRAIDAMLAAESAPPVAGLAPVDVVQTGARHYQQLRSKFGHLSGRNGFKQYFLRTRGPRDAALAAGKDDFLRLIRQGDSSERLKAQLDEWFAVPGDTDNSAGRELMTVGLATVAELQWQENLAMYSQREQPWLQRNGTLVVPANAGPPDADDITVALLREYALHGGKREKPRVTIYQPIHMKIFGTRLEMSVHDVNIKRVGRMENGNYAVEFEARLNIDYNADPATANAMRQGSYVLLTQLFDQVNASPPALRTGEFSLTPEGWRSPTEQQLMQEGANQVLRMASSLLDDTRRRIFGPRTIIIYP